MLSCFCTNCTSSFLSISFAGSLGQSLNAGVPRSSLPSPLLLLKLPMTQSGLILSHGFQYSWYTDNSSSSDFSELQIPTAYLISALESVRGTANSKYPPQNSWFHLSPSLVCSSPTVTEDRTVEGIFAVFLFLTPHFICKSCQCSLQNLCPLPTISPASMLLPEAMYYHNSLDTRSASSLPSLLAHLQSILRLTSRVTF